MAFRFKRGEQVRLRNEFEKMDPRLQVLSLSLMGFCLHHFHKDLVVTEIYRTEEQQRSYYPDRPYRPSVHQFGRGIDFGIRKYPADQLEPYPYPYPRDNPAFSNEELDLLTKWYEQAVSYDDERPEYDSLIHHNVGLGDHLHLQVSWRKTTRLRSNATRVDLLAQRLSIALGGPQWVG